MSQLRKRLFYLAFDECSVLSHVFLVQHNLALVFCKQKNVLYSQNIMLCLPTLASIWLPFVVRERPDEYSSVKSLQHLVSSLSFSPYSPLPLPFNFFCKLFVNSNYSVKFLNFILRKILPNLD